MEPIELREAGDKYLEHYGKMGMRWGHRSGSSSIGSTLDRGKAAISKIATNISPTQKKVAIIAASSGAVVAAGLLAGPVGSMVASSLSRIVTTTTTSRDSSFPVPPGTGGEFKGSPSWMEGPKDH